MAWARRDGHERVVDSLADAAGKVEAGRGGNNLSTSLSIVVVEDEPLTRASLVTFFEKAGHRVRPASCVAAARAALAQAPADIVLLDIGLPGEDGVSYARELRAEATCGVIMVSHESEIATRIIALDAGADDYLTKPIDFDELAARVRSVARRRRPRRERLAIGHLELDLDKMPCDNNEGRPTRRRPLRR